MPGGQRLPGERGFALLIVLLVLGFLALLGTHFIAAGRAGTALARNGLTAAEVKAATIGAIEAEIFALLNGTTTAPRQVRIDGTLVDLSVSDEGNLLNPNLAGAIELTTLFEELGADTQTAKTLAAAILDWRTDDTLPRPSGAKAPQYRAAGRVYGPADTSFSSIAELGLVLGMTPALLDLLRPQLAVFTSLDPICASTHSIVARAVQAATSAGSLPKGGDLGSITVQRITAAGYGPDGASTVMHSGRSSERHAQRLAVRDPLLAQHRRIAGGHFSSAGDLHCRASRSQCPAMAQFRYTAIGARGEMQRGILEAASEAEVVAKLRRQGSLPMRAEPMTEGGLFRSLLHADFLPRGGLSAQQITDLTRELATMLAAGQDLDRALRYALETAPNARVRIVLTRIRDQVRDGAPLSTTLSKEPASFSRLYVGMVRAGEASGRLAEALARLADLLERQRRVAAAVTSALIYPCLLLVAAVGAVSLLLTQVLPQFVPLFEQNGVQLPTSTQFLIDVGAFVSNWGILMLLIGFVLVLLGGAALRRPGPRLMADRLLLRVPIFGPLQRELIAARFTRALGTLLVNGVPLIPALGIARDALGNRVAMVALDRATQSARGGGSLAQPLADAAVFPVRTIHLLRLGEENAQLGTMALHAAEIHEERSQISVQRLVAMMVPAITIVMGAVVAGIVASLLSAMLSLNNLAAGG